MRYSNSQIPHSRPDLGEAEAHAAAAVVRSLMVKGGTHRDALERAVAADQGFEAGIATSSCTQALLLFLLTAFPEGGARVALSSLVCRSVFDAVRLARCEPVLVDIDPTTLCLNPAAALAMRPDAIVAAHLAGVACPVANLTHSDAWIIEDCAQRIVRNNHPSAQARLVRLFSFDATKVITCGEGGMLLSDDAAFAEQAKHTRAGEYSSTAPSLWTGLSDIQAAVAMVQWERLHEFAEKRRRIAEQYFAAFAPEWIHPSMHLHGTTFFRFLLRVPDAPGWVERERQGPVAYRRPVAPMALHQLFSFPGEFPHTESTLREVLSIPIHTTMNESEIDRVIAHTSTLLENL